MRGMPGDFLNRPRFVHAVDVAGQVNFATATGADADIRKAVAHQGLADAVLYLLGHDLSRRPVSSLSLCRRGVQWQRVLIGNFVPRRAACRELESLAGSRCQHPCSSTSNSQRSRDQDYDCDAERCNTEGESLQPASEKLRCD